ncbi:unnamed protein product [Leptidea sinapis]|uniref:BAH domain-containing protein n=1 Tax=Leptidea sinapis TaxID=189913 RepID=A0A5E4QNI9_9NEOP|nr:unnamed protein product [Leptidea sinapis]
MFDNACKYNEPDSQIYKDALILQRVMKRAEKVRAISLDLVKRRLDKGLARRLSRTDSQIFEDAVELQAYYIEQRDLLCRNTLISPALNFTKDTMTTSVELIKQCKLLQENDEEDETRSSTDESLPTGAPPQTQYGKGDFVYIQGERGAKEPNIVQMERLPHETFHVRTRKFLQQEVFKTEIHRSIPLEHVVGRCYVMNVKEYFKFRPEEGSHTRTQIVSVFRERVEKHKDELAELEILENDVVMYNPLGTDDENTYYEQYNTVCSGVVKTGDYVYVVTDGGKQLIAQVDTIWETGDNKCYFRGPFLIFPSEVANVINKPFYKQEVLLTTMHDTSPLVGIVGKCSVLDYDDYLK